MWFEVLVSLLASIVTLIVLIQLRWPWVWYDFKHFSRFLPIGVAIREHLKKALYIIDVFESRARDLPEKTFLIFQDETYTYYYINKQANRVAHGAQKIGLKRGDTIAMMIYNGPEFIWTYLGLVKIGVQPAFLNFNLRSRSLLQCIVVSEPKILIVGKDDELSTAITDILPDLKEKLPNMDIYLQGSNEKQGEFHSFEDLMNVSSDQQIDSRMRRGTKFNDTVCFIYTSGTTGLPKAAVVTHSKYMKGALMMQLAKVNKDDVIYTALPMYHTAAGVIALGNTITLGATLVLRKKFSVTHFWEDCRKHDVTVIQYIGELCRYLLVKPKQENDSKHKVRIAFGNGLRADIWKEFMQRFNLPVICEFYGATEGNAGLVNVNNKVGAVGRLSPIIDIVYPVVMIKYDIAKYEPVRDENGLCVKIKPGETGLMVCKIKLGLEYDGYKGNRELSDKKIIRNVLSHGDTFCNSGDLFHVDDDYFVYFKDRTGDTFRWKGENVSTTEVSNVVSDLSFIQDVNVYGVDVPGCDGRAGMAAFSLKTDEIITEEQLREIYRHCEDLLPSYARPKFLRQQKELLLTSTFKQMKVGLVAEGFHPEKVKNDSLYVVDDTNKSYVALTKQHYEQVLNGKMKL